MYFLAIYGMRLARAGKPVFAGIWQNIRAYQAAISGDQLLTDDDIAFLQGSALAGLITTGCNIPIFVAAHASEQIIPFTRPNPDFFWLNYYDKDDVLGWPLADLSISYQQLVTDFSINAHSGLFGWITASWNPFSHNQYWQDKQIIAAITQQLKNIISGPT